MARNKKTPLSSQVAEAQMLEEAADTKLKAAEKMARANRLMADQDPEPDPDPIQDRHARFTPFMPPEADPGPAPLSRIEQVVDEMRGQGKFEVYKLIGSNKSKVGVYALEEWPDLMDSIAQENGGGTFRIVFKDERGLYVASDTQTFDTKSYGKPHSNEDSGLGKLLERMEQREEKMATQMEQMRAENMRLLLSIVEKSNSAPARSTSELVELMKFMRENQPEARSPIDSIKEILELAAVVKEEAGATEPEHPLVAAIDKVFKTIQPFIGAWAQKVAQTPAATPARALLPSNPASTGALVASEAHAPMIPNQPVAVGGPAESPAPAAPAPVDARLLQYAQSLLAQAELDASFEAVGDSILNLTPDANLDSLAEMVNDPAFVGLLIAAEPKLVKHQRWLVELSRYISNELTEPAGEEPLAGAITDASPEPAVVAP
jgi:hypothetical protein